MSKSRKRLLIAWALTIAAVIVLRELSSLLDRMGRSFAPVGILNFFAWLGLITLTTWIVGVFLSFLLRKLFWSVGRRLALSYLLIGLLPFILFAILFFVVGYIAAGVLSQTSFRADRQATLSRLDQSNLEYALSGVKPADALSSLEIHDSRNGTAHDLPQWLREGTFIGLVKHGGEAVFVAARTYKLNGTSRSVVFVQPVDDAWSSDLQKTKGLVIWHVMSHRERGGDPSFKISSSSNGESKSSKDGSTISRKESDDKQIKALFLRTVQLKGVAWWDMSSDLLDWDTGRQTEQQVFFFISNPWRNLLDFYFGSPDYLDALLAAILGIAALLAVIYLIASLFAGGLIYSISSAVNRIERGTRAVERGDFSYRIGLKRRNQLGDVAQSFDRMTESISSLLSKVTEQERLQSEINIAASIQRNLLPREGPRFRGVSFSAHFEPTASIGGDYYDVFNIDRHRLAVTIGDVSGHGLSTGLVMAMVKAAITTLVEEGADEQSLFRRLNDLVYRSTERRAFMTLGFTIFDLDKRTIRHTNAGHLYPYVLRKDAVPIEIEVPSLPLGIRPGIESRTVEMDLREGDTVVYLSDGIIEALDLNGSAFGFNRLESILEGLTGEAPATVQEAILAAVAEHTGGGAADDDSTIMILQFEQLAGKGEAVAELAAEDELAAAGH